MVTDKTDKDERSERMQRIRVGLTGIAVVLLLILLATAVFKGLGIGGGNDVSVAANGEVEGSGDEPLADLGVAPGAPDNAAEDAQNALDAQNAAAALPLQNGTAR